MKLYNYELADFIEFLFHLKLIDKDSRMRSRLIKLLTEYVRRLQSEYNELLEHYAEKDEQGKLVYEEREEGARVSIRQPEAFQKANQQLLEEEVVIDQTDERKEMLLIVKEAVLNCGIVFEGVEAARYSRWCEIIEEIHYKEEMSV
ncbi:hypothetical protein [Paenibacillus pinihumi]|uniref:hypothetical protein n=1 Tax=Paenibacillus pinihumi TaxID=669462 RepID=UPI000410D5ED|nr:hypothetical protein [Paenibacillus pinihumi]